MYFDQLKFLHKLYVERPTSNSLEPRNDIADEDEDGIEQEQQASDDVSVVFKSSIEKPRNSQKNMKYKNQNDIDLRILKLLEEQQPPCNKMAFLQSLMPHLQNFNDQEYLKFQMGVLKVIENINESKKEQHFFPPSNLAPYQQFLPQSRPLYVNTSNSTQYHPQQLYNTPSQSNIYLSQPYTSGNQQVLLPQQIPSCSKQPPSVTTPVTYPELEQDSPSLNSIASSISDSIDFSTSI